MRVQPRAHACRWSLPSSLPCPAPPRRCSPAPLPLQHTHAQAFVDFETPEEAGRSIKEKDHKVFSEKFGDRYVRLIQVGAPSLTG